MASSFRLHNPETKKPMSLQDMWEDALKTIPDPPIAKKCWNTDPNRKLSIVLVEFREHEWMEHVIRNNTWVYGGQDVGLTIVHGIGNKNFVHSITKEHIGVHYVEYPVQNISWYEYSKYLTDAEFYNRLIGEYILVIQCDTITLKKFDEYFYNFDYVGAPWHWYIDSWAHAYQGPFAHRRVGNGGYSLRKKSVMMELCLQHKDEDKSTEDTFFSSIIPDERFPTFEDANRFSVESVYYSDPCGLHKCYANLQIDALQHLLQLLPTIYKEDVSLVTTNKSQSD